MEDNPNHTPTTEGELLLDSELLDCLSEDEFWLLPFPLVPSSSPEPLLIPPSTPSSASSLMKISRRFPASLPLPPPLYQTASSSAMSRLPQESPSAHPQHTMSGRLVALRDHLSPVTLVTSASSFRDPVSTSALWPIGSWLPRPSGSALVSRPPAYSTGLHSSSYASSLWPYRAPPSLQLHLGPPDPRVTQALRPPSTDLFFGLFLFLPLFLPLNFVRFEWPRGHLTDI